MCIFSLLGFPCNRGSGLTLTKWLISHTKSEKQLLEVDLSDGCIVYIYYHVFYNVDLGMATAVYFSHVKHSD